MSLNDSGSSSLREIDRWDGGAGWLASPDERLQRASHALVDGDDVWLIDPVDADGLDAFLSELGEVVGVLVLLDRHTRDAATIARRHGVSVYRPAWMASIDSALDVPVTSLGGELGGTGFTVQKRIDLPIWKEAVLYRPDDALFVPESLGTATHFCAPGERLGVHPMLRLTPPTELALLDPERVLVGHGPGIHEHAAMAIEEAIGGSRSRAPALVGEIVSELLSR